VIRGDSDIYQPVPEDSKFGATWTTNRRRYRKAGARGNSRTGKSAPPKDVKVGATRRSIAGKAGDAGRGATQVLHQGRCTEEARDTGETRNLAETSTAEGMRSSGQLERTIAGTAEGPEPRGNPRRRTPAQQKGSEVRGNPETQPGLGGKMQDAG